jgi:hypothetical protein
VEDDWGGQPDVVDDNFIAAVLEVSESLYAARMRF